MFQLQHNVSKITTGSAEIPSPLIDAAICDLILAVGHFSDEYFDSVWLDLKEEIEFLTVKLIQFTAKNLEGQMLEDYLQQIRGEVDSF